MSSAFKKIAKAGSRAVGAASSAARAGSKAGKKAFKKAGKFNLGGFMKKAGKKGGKVVDKAASAGKVAAKKAGKLGDKVAAVGKKCTKNPKMCAAAVATAGATAYMANKYLEMSAEQEECMNFCFPENWHQYVEGSIPRPNYKVIDGSSLNDSSIKYAPLYDDDEVSSKLCTPDTLAEYDIQEGKDSCNVFCEAACDFDITDVVEETVKDGVSGAKKVVKEGTKAAASVTKDLAGSVLEGLGIDLEKVKKYGIMGASVIAILCVLSIVMKLKSMFM